MRVCLVCLGYPSAAHPIVTPFICRQATALAKNGCDIEVITRGGAGDKPEESSEGMCVHRVMAYDDFPQSFMQVIFPLKALAKALALHKSKPFDVVHAHFADVAGFAGALISNVLGIPLVLTVHGGDLRTVEIDGVFEGVGWLASRLYVPIALNCAQKIVTQSPELYGLLKKRGVGEGKLALIPNGVDVSSFRRVASIRRKTRNRFGLKRGDIAVLFFARMAAIRDPLTFVRAVPFAREKNKHLKFFMAGDGELFPEVRKTIGELGLRGSVRLLGGIRKPETLLNAADIGVALCPVENVWSMTILEMMACSIPLVVTRAGLTGRYLRDEIDCMLVPPKNPEALADALCRLAENSEARKRLGKNGRRRVVENFAQTIMLEGLNRLYAEVVCRASQPSPWRKNAAPLQRFPAPASRPFRP